jgi:hypothetical protein
MMRKIFLPVAVAALALAALAVKTNAYTLGAAKWSTSVVTFYANPSNQDVDPTTAENALIAALGAWGSQSSASFQFAYGGRVNDTATGYDGRNVLLFRNASNGGAIASTYSWWSGSTLVDADTVFWDGGFQFAGNSPCVTGGEVYIQDVATHELGHALGLGHSTVGDATMYPSYSGCSQELRTLAADDISGVEALYPPSTRQQANAAPTLTIQSPTNGGSYVSTTPLTLSASANDTEDGDLSGYVVWSSSLVAGALGTGNGLSVMLPAGSQNIVASVTDSAGAATTKQVTITVSAPVDPTQPTLTVRAYKVKGTRRADLKWTNLGTPDSITRNGASLTTVAGTSYTDPIGGKTAGTFTYTVCDQNGRCTNSASAKF